MFQQATSYNLPVVIPMTTFSPPSNPVVHHSLIGPIAFVAIPPSVERNDVKESTLDHVFGF